MVLSIENEIFRRGLPEKLRFLDLSQLIPPASPEENLQKPFLAYVFCQCFLISRLTKMIRTILESSDHAEKVDKTIGAPRWLRHALKRRYAKNSTFFYMQFFVIQHILGMTESRIWTSIATDILIG